MKRAKNNCMENKILYSEIQKFRQKWLWILLVGLNIGILILQFTSESVEGRIIFLPFLLITILFLITRMETKIKKEGI